MGEQTCIGCGNNQSFLRPKGLLSILIERRLLPEEARTRKWRSDKNKHAVCHKCKDRAMFDPDRESRTDCCLQRMLESQPDVLARKNRVTEILESAGHRVLYLPKFHPELNRTCAIQAKADGDFLDVTDCVKPQRLSGFGRKSSSTCVIWRTRPMRNSRSTSTTP